MKLKDLENGRMLAVDYFAGIALGYFLKKYNFKIDLASDGDNQYGDFFKEICSVSYEIATAMLVSRDNASEDFCNAD